MNTKIVKKSNRLTFSLAAVALALVSYAGVAQDRFADVEIKAQALKGSVHMLTGAGGNIGVSAGEDGILIIDDQYAPLAKKIAKALDTISKKDTKYVINTHFHGDHTGSNAFFHENKNATIFAHENVRVRLAQGDNADPKALPVVTYEDGVKFYFNNETIHVFHLSEGHTDGDSAVWFEEPNVLHTGDLFFKDTFPFVDINGGGSVSGYIESVNTLLDMITDDTIIIPGHGEVASKTDYKNFVLMMEATLALVNKKKSEGMTEQQIIDEGLGEEWKAWSWNFITEERWIKTLYK